MKKLSFVLLCAFVYMQSATITAEQLSEKPIQVKGVFPNLTVMAEGIGSDSETGIGARFPGPTGCGR